MGGIWLYTTVLLVGYAGGIITGVVIDKDTFYKLTIGKIKQKRSGGKIDVVVDQANDDDKAKILTRKDKRIERRTKRKANRELKKNLDSNT